MTLFGLSRVHFSIVLCRSFQRPLQLSWKAPLGGGSGADSISATSHSESRPFAAKPELPQEAPFQSLLRLVAAARRLPEARCPLVLHR